LPFKANGDLWAFFARPLAGTLGAITIAIIVIPALWHQLRRAAR